MYLMKLRHLSKKLTDMICINYTNLTNCIKVMRATVHIVPYAASFFIFIMYEYEILHKA